MSEELKPCPFCGGEANLEEVPCSPFDDDYGSDYSAGCKECNIGWYKDSKEEAIAAWNRRADGWISVAERLPKVSDTYLVVVKEKDIFKDRWLYHVDVASNYGSYIDDYWDTFIDWFEGQEVHITHWMPLPKPPKEA